MWGRGLGVAPLILGMVLRGGCGAELAPNYSSPKYGTNLLPTCQQSLVQDVVDNPELENEIR